MNKLTKWRKTILKAKKRGNFTPIEIRQASAMGWKSCAIGEKLKVEHQNHLLKIIGSDDGSMATVFKRDMLLTEGLILETKFVSAVFKND